MRLPAHAAVVPLVVVVLAAPGSSAPVAAVETQTHTTVAAKTQSKAHSKAIPSLRVRRQVRNLDVPWDVQPIGTGQLLITERDSAHLLLWESGNTRRVEFPSQKVWVSGETGLMSLEVDPGFEENRRFYTCQGGNRSRGRHEVKVVAWRLNETLTRARRVETLLDRLPITGGRHGGCRLLILDGGSLLVGTGDAAVGSHPRNLRSLGGKTLRLDRMSGKPWPGNPFVTAENRRKRYVHTFGHRNVQGLAQRRDGTLWSVEHGTTRDDEVNLLRKGRDYGWHPVPGYNESVPMTDESLPGNQVGARWRSGFPTLATSGAAWVRGAEWGGLKGTLAVAALKASRVVFMKFDNAGRLRWTRAPRTLRGFGRLRSVTLAPNNDLLVTSDNDNGRDAVIRVSPR